MDTRFKNFQLERKRECASAEYLWRMTVYANIDKDTNIALYADDTKIWRDINSEADCEILQKDINSLSMWSRNYKMSFHPDKCKALSIYDQRPNFVKILPFAHQYYNINGSIIEFCENERDLGVIVNSNFKSDDHHDKILKKLIKC